VPVAAVYAVILALWFGLRERMGRIGFYLLFAATVTISVQLVGLYLVFASLIIPALATYYRPRRRLATGYALGVGGYALGLAASAVFDLPAGAVVVWALALLSTPVFLLSGRSASRES